MRFKNALLITLFVTLIAAGAHATTAYIRPPYLSYSFEIEEGMENIFPGTIEIKNVNSFPVTVVFSKPGWIEIVDSIDLDPGDALDVDFEMTFTQAGTYNGEIAATYTAPGKFSAPASSSIHVDAVPGGSAPTTTTTVPPAGGTTTSTTTTTLPPTTTTVPPAGETTTTMVTDTTVPQSTTTTAPGAEGTTSTTIGESSDAITVSITQGPSGAEIAAITVVVISVAVGAVLILKR